MPPTFRISGSKTGQLGREDLGVSFENAMPLTPTERTYIPEYEKKNHQFAVNHARLDAPCILKDIYRHQQTVLLRS